MSFDFPSSGLTVGQIVTGPNNIQYRWDGVKWVAATASGMIGGPGITISDTPPASPSLGNLWFDSVGLQLYVWYTDPTSSQWVPVTSQSGLAAIGATNTGRNLLHNPMFTILQRGLGPWTTSGYNADQWLMGFASDTASCQVYSLTDTDRAQIGDEEATYGYQVTFTGNSAAGAYTGVNQEIEMVRRLAGKTVTVSFWAIASVALRLGVSFDQLFGSSGSALVSLNGQSVAVGTSWARYSLTFNIPSIQGKTLGGGNDRTQLGFWYSSGSTNNARAGNIGVQAGTISLWGVQLEIGNVATPLAKRDPADDLALCQRFYVSQGGLSIGGGGTNNTMTTIFSFPVTMRANPNVTINVASSGGTWAGATVGMTSPECWVFNLVPTGTGGWFGNLAYAASAEL